MANTSKSNGSDRQLRAYTMILWPVCWPAVDLPALTDNLCLQESSINLDRSHLHAVCLYHYETLNGLRGWHHEMHKVNNAQINVFSPQITKYLFIASHYGLKKLYNYNSGQYNITKQDITEKQYILHMQPKSSHRSNGQGSAPLSRWMLHFGGDKMM